MSLHLSKSLDSRGYDVSGHLPESLFMGDGWGDRVVEELVTKVADKILADNFEDIIKSLDFEHISKLAGLEIVKRILKP